MAIMIIIILLKRKEDAFLKKKLESKLVCI